jgi:hypothetical protein
MTSPLRLSELCANLLFLAARTQFEHLFVRAEFAEVWRGFRCD